MVQMMSSGKKMKAEPEDQPRYIHKKPKLDSSFPSTISPPSMYNPLDEPSPLGLRLRKSSSLQDLIEMRLSQENKTKLETLRSKKDHTVVADKLKASNFPACLLRIGTWEYKSRYEGDLVAKCYFAKHKLVWEVLDGNLKNKIEIQWSDIMAIKADYPEDGLGTLNVVLARPPQFFRETNPQPRKHTLWQATSDFTGGQASLHRKHFLQCPQGLMGKHFEKLVQCDPRLNYLSQQPEISLESPYFESKTSTLGGISSSMDGLDFEHLEQPFSGFQEVASPSGVHSSSLENEHQNFLCRIPEDIPHEALSPTSDFRTVGAEKDDLHITKDQIGSDVIQHSVLANDIVSLFDNSKTQNTDILEEIAQHLLSDSQLMSMSDEQSLISRVNSLCSLLQKDPITPQTSTSAEKTFMSRVDSLRCLLQIDPVMAQHLDTKYKNTRGKQLKEESVTESKISTKDSVGELLLNLPRIASLPHFMFNIAEESKNQAR